MTDGKQPLTYRDAGVDIDAGDALIDRIAPAAKRTTRSGVLGGLGGFSSLFELPKGYREPVLVAGTDGVGTKLRLAIDWQRHDTVGIDLVQALDDDRRRRRREQQRDHERSEVTMRRHGIHIGSAGAERRVEYTTPPHAHP